MKAAKARQTDLEVRCQEPTCLCTEATITYTPDSVAVAWSKTCDTFLDRHTADSFLDRSTPELQKLYRSFPPLFCSHFQVSPERLFHLEQSVTSLSGRWYTCNHCPTSVHVTADGGSRKIASSCRFVCYLEDVEEMMQRWIGLLDPDTYGQFEDPDTKHITWCDDRSCATTCELAAFSVSIFVTGAYPGNSFRSSYGAGMDHFDSIVNWKFGIERLEFHWREGCSWKAWAKDMLGYR
jgi:hypothetical protein